MINFIFLIYIFILKAISYISLTTHVYYLRNPKELLAPPRLAEKTTNPNARA